MSPKSDACDIYVAKSIQDLNSRTDNFPTDRIKNLPLMKLLKCTKMLLDDADISYDLRDEEMAYIKYNRYFIMRDLIRDNPDYCKYQDVVEKILGDSQKYDDRAWEVLRPSLIKRYAEIEEYEARTNEEFEMTNPYSEPSSPTQIEDYYMPRYYITCAELYELLLDDMVLIMLLDCRSFSDYHQSRIRHACCLNIDEAKIERGITPEDCVEHFQFDDRYLEIWKSRFNMKHIIVYDWYTDDEIPSYETPLCVVKDMLEYYDDAQYESLRFLKGGYAEFLKLYPEKTTNKKVETPPKPHEPDECTIEIDSTHDIMMLNDTVDITIKEVQVIGKNSSPESVKKFNDQSLRKLANEQVELITENIELIKEKLSAENELNCTLKMIECATDGETKEIELEKAIQIEYKIMELDTQRRDLDEESIFLAEELSKSLQASSSSLPISLVNEIKTKQCEIEKLIKKAEKINNKNRESVNRQQLSFQEPTCFIKAPEHEFELVELRKTSIQGHTGLKNIGNMCYMLCILQSFSNTEPLKTFITKKRYSRIPGNKPIIEKLENLLSDIWSGKYAYVTPSVFQRALGAKVPMVLNGMQQDAFELFESILDALEAELKKTTFHPQPNTKNNAINAWNEYKKKNPSIITDMFYGLNKRTIKCEWCQGEHYEYEPIRFCPLYVQTIEASIELKKCLDITFGGEKREGTCENCCGCTPHVSKLSIYRLPTILVIYINRINDGYKNKVNVKYPLEDLDMSSYLSKDSPNRQTPNHSKYKLYAIVNHYGETIDSGHYTAYILENKSKEWYRFNDHIVESLTKRQVVTSAAYLLFYTLLKS